MGIKIVVTVRTRDEEHRIGQFCEAYKDADTIIVSDGGSVDNTIEIAKKYPNVMFYPFEERTKMQNGYWRNNDSAHANFMFSVAYDLKPDWIIYDDCDMRPNYLLKQDYRKILSETDCDLVMAVRIYLWGKDKHFPNMAKPMGAYAPTLFAWRGSVDLWTVNVPPAYSFRIGARGVADFHADAKVLDLLPPYCLLHYSWDNPDRVEQKIKIYRESGLIPDMRHPLDFAGPLALLEDWMRE